MQTVKIIRAHEVRPGDVVYTNLNCKPFASDKVILVSPLEDGRTEVVTSSSAIFDNNDEIILISRPWLENKPVKKMIGQIVRLLPHDRHEHLSLWDFDEFCQNKKDITKFRDAIDQYLMGLPK